MLKTKKKKKSFPEKTYFLRFALADLLPQLTCNKCWLSLLAAGPSSQAGRELRMYGPCVRYREMSLRLHRKTRKRKRPLPASTLGYYVHV